MNTVWRGQGGGWGSDLVRHRDVAGADEVERENDGYEHFVEGAGGGFPVHGNVLGGYQ